LDRPELQGDGDVRALGRVAALLTAFLVLSVLYAPVVLGAETRTISGFLRLDDESPFDANYTFNLSDPDNLDLLNWNQTVEGFQNDSGIVGAFTGPFLPPVEALGAVNRNDVQTLTVCGKVRFKTEWVMSGSSESWWRVPERGPYYGDNVNLTIWRVGSPDLLNFTDALVPNTASHPIEVFNHSYDLDEDELNYTFRWYNTTAWNHTFNSTWLRVMTPIHGDDFYAVRWEMTNRSTWAEHWVRFSQNDIGDDKDFSTWLFYPNNTRGFIGADLDFSVIHTSGHGYSVWGTEVGPSMEVLWEENWTGVDGEDIYTYDSDWAYQAGDNDPPPEIDDDVPDATFTWSCLVPADTSNMYFENYVAEGPGEHTGYVRVKTYLRNALNGGDIRIYCYGNNAQKGGSIYYSNQVMNIYWSGGSQGYAGYPPNAWYEIWIDIHTSIDKVAFWIEDPTTGIMERKGDAWYPGIGAAAAPLDGFRIFSSKQSDSWLGPITILDMEAPDLEWNTELETPITEGDNLTVMVPFLDTVTNDTNVLIGFGTQNDSWSTAFWVAEHGPTDFGIKSVSWDVSWPATEMKMHMTIYNTSRRQWIVDRNTLNDPDLTRAYNRYSVDDHRWAPDNYYFGGVPYHAMQITNGSWENADVRPAYFVGGREVRPDEVIKQSEHSDDWYVELWLTGYEGVARVTASISFALTGQWDKASAALNPEVPFPTDAPWFFGKYLYPGIWAIGDFLGNVGEKVWAAAVWIYEGIQWIVANAPWIIAGTLMIVTFFIIIPLWARFYRVLQGLIRFGWIMADQGMVAAADFADAFWTEYVSTSYVKKVVGRLRGGG
jgi:hypothetical protein